MSEVKKVVDALNKTLMESDELLLDDEYFSFLEHTETPMGAFIKYMGKCIWDSENDAREWIDDDTQEDMESYLIRQMIGIQKIINKSVDVLLQARW